MNKLLRLSTSLLRAGELCLLMLYNLRLNAQLNPPQPKDRKVTIIGNNITLEVAFMMIREQTKMTCMFDGSAIDVELMLSANYVNKPLSVVLTGILTPHKIQWLITNRNILLRKQEPRSARYWLFTYPIACQHWGIEEANKCWH